MATLLTTATLLCSVMGFNMDMIDSTQTNQIRLSQASNHFSPFVAQSDDEFLTDTEKSFNLVNQFLLGMRYQQLLPSSLNCSYFVEQSIQSLNDSVVQWNYDKDENSGYTTKADDYIFNVTEWLSYSVAPGIRYCFNIGLEGYTYYLLKDEQFGPFVDWFPAWLQNLLGNSMTFKALADKIGESQDSGNEADSMFWVGRIVYIVFDFEPVNSGSTNVNFESDAAQPWWLGGGGEENQLAHDFSVESRRSQINRNLMDAHHPRVQGWFDDTFGFLSGFLNITFGDQSPNATVCLTNITRVVEVSLNFGKHIRVVSNDSWLSASYDFQMIFETIHPIFFSCYRSGYEYFEAAKGYGITFTDWRNIVYNLIHNVGFLYDAIYFLVIHHIDFNKEEIKEADPNVQSNWWFKLGVYYGTIILRIFYTDKNTFDAIDPMADLIGVVPKWMEDLQQTE